MAITVLSNASPSAPTLSGSAGALVAVLDYCLVTALGWTKSGSGNVVAYRQPAGTNQFYLRVDDTGTTSARVRAYEALTDVAAPTGTNPTPSDAQFSGGLYWGKAIAAGATARPWMFISDGKLFHLVVGMTTTAPAWGGVQSLYTFGDFSSFKSGDAYNTMIVGDTNVSPSASVSYISAAAAPSTNVTSPSQGHYILRPHTQLSTSITASRIADIAGAGGTASYFGAGAIAYPAPITGGIEIARAFIGESVGRRGRIPGLWCPQHAATILNDADTFSGASGTDLAGKSFVFLRLGGQAQGAVALETSDTWST